jgi:hypothetical protein
MTHPEKMDTPKKEHIVSFRVSFTDADRLKRQARKNGETLSEHLNNVFLKHYGRG